MEARMATEELTPPGDRAEPNNYMPFGQPGAHGADPNGDAGWLAGQAAASMGGPTHHDASYAGMTSDPPGSGTHAAHGYDEYKHQGRET
jgi:hypothetical protein